MSLHTQAVSPEFFMFTHTHCLEVGDGSDGKHLSSYINTLKK